MTTVKNVERTRARLRVRPRVVAGPPATVTVVVTCYNYGHFLRQAVESALTQQGVEVDVVIVDDASSDDSLEIARSLERADGRVRIIAHPRNEGVVAAFNDGADGATGEFLVRLDADDVLAPGALFRATQLGQAFPSVGLIYGHPVHFEGTTLPPARSKVTAWTVWQGAEWLGDRCRSGMNVITSPEVVMRTSTMNELGPQAALRHTHDMEYWLRFAAFSDVAYLHGADQAWHREHAASLSATHVDQLVDIRGRVAAFDTLFAGVAGSRPHIRQLAPVATATLVREALAGAQHEIDRGLPNPRLFDEYLRVAHELDDDVLSSPRWLRLREARSTLASRRGLAIGPLVRRSRDRLKSDISWLRWHRNGVY